MEEHTIQATSAKEKITGVPDGDIRINMHWLSVIAHLVSKEDLFLAGKPNGVISNATFASFRLEKGNKEKPAYQKLFFYSDGCFVWVFGYLGKSPMPEREDDFELLASHDSAWFLDGMDDFYKIL